MNRELFTKPPIVLVSIGILATVLWSETRGGLHVVRYGWPITPVVQKWTGCFNADEPPPRVMARRSLSCIFKRNGLTIAIADDSAYDTGQSFYGLSTDANFSSGPVRRYEMTIPFWHAQTAVGLFAVVIMFMHATRD